MTSWQMVRIVAGVLILLTVALALPQSPLFHSSHWLWFTAFIGINLLQSGFSKWCLMETIMHKLGFARGA